MADLSKSSSRSLPFSEASSAALQTAAGTKRSPGSIWEQSHQPPKYFEMWLYLSQFIGFMAQTLQATTQPQHRTIAELLQATLSTLRKLGALKIAGTEEAR
jgi:uncharacterized membrane protein